MGRRQDDAGHTAVVESILVGITVIAAVAFVGTFAEPDATGSDARSVLTSGGTDALYVLSELPASLGTPHESLLEEYVTLALRGDCSPLETKLEGYFAQGVAWGMYLEKGHGDTRAVCAVGAPSGSMTTTFTTIQPRWNKLFVVPNVSQISGVVELDAFGRPVDVDPLTVHGVLVRNSFLDEKTNVTLRFENGHVVPFGSSNGMRFTGRLSPEHVTATGAQDGYAVPYATNGTWLDYKASTIDLGQLPSTYDVAHNLGAISSLQSIAYEVHPGYTMSGVISSSIDALDEDEQFHSSGEKAKLGSSMRFTWNYGTIASSLAKLRLADGSIKVYDPVGAVADKMQAREWSGNRSFTIEEDMLWGTYVAHLNLELEEVDAFGVPTGKVYIVNQLTHFSVIPPEWMDLPHHIPPVYRVTLSVGQEAWG